MQRRYKWANQGRTLYFSMYISVLAFLLYTYYKYLECSANSRALFLLLNTKERGTNTNINNEERPPPTNTNTNYKRREYI